MPTKEELMPGRQPVAFMSYVQSDDQHDNGRITKFRTRLEGEVRMQTGKPFAIFQDRNDILWGQHWKKRIDNSLSEATFLIPVLTPSFFESPACRNEFETFLVREKTLGANRLILPFYYVDCDQLATGFSKQVDLIADILRDRQWTDWRPYRFKSFEHEDAAGALAAMASMIKAAIKEIESLQAEAIEKSSKSVAATAVEKDDEAAIEQESEEELRNVYNLLELRGARKKVLISEKLRPKYYVYTRRFDEVVRANEFSDANELIKLHDYISKHANRLKNIYGGKLNDAVQKMHKHYNIIDGKPAPGLALSILLDNSGSMRGSKITHVAAWSLILTEMFEGIGLSTEVLGFTTRAWKGGQSRELWLKDKKPANPGRLNDLRHVIYKSFNDSIAAASVNFGIMAREGLLKENIDGEAVLWAAARIRKRAEPRKYLCVISDGAPVDDSTLSVNSPEFLSSHLTSVSSEIKQEGIIKLIGIGINHDAAEYYPLSFAANEKSLGLDIIGALMSA